MLVYYFPLILFTILLTFVYLYVVLDSFNDEKYFLSFILFILIIVLDIYVALSVKSGINHQKDLFNAVDLGYEVYIDGQKSDIDFTSDFIINNYVFTIDDENHYISCTNKYE